ncbi:NAD(P)H-binding protein [Nocardia sp. alder85J]|uniref:NAD(P)H-binding protein n=1 Tax=Nocardia sp. alder85J TaxID=2862949 RepID=UPI001CD5FFEC|nr:NAD(P)H-binding protein [Nocardia sp. alder85J]MCX4098720.1 NAD(P)H-binding protein [Nocardia sp. alder85J]
MILVTGATGNVGSALVRALDRRGVEVRILVREPARAADLPARARRVVADLTDPATLPPAFEGVDAAFLMIPGLAVAPAAAAVAAARRAGVRRLVLLSSFNVLGDPMPAMGRWHHERERIVRDSGISATILRPGGYMTNALEWVTAIRAGQPVLDPSGPGRYAPIDPADIAAVAALALTEDGHDGAEYVLTGDETFTAAEQVAVLAAALGRVIPVRTAATPEEAVRARYADGAPPALAEAILEGFTLMRADTTGLRTDTVATLLGRPPRTFADWCTRHAGRFR